jgi:hypothetical protein
MVDFGITPLQPWLSRGPPGKTRATVSKLNAVARMEENTLIVQWVEQSLERRVSSYSWALQRLVIQGPDNIAADADRLIGELAAQTTRQPILEQPAIRPAVSVRG